MSRRIKNKVNELLTELYKTTGETIDWYFSDNNKPYPKEEKTKISNRPILSSKLFLNMGQVRQIQKDDLTLYVIPPKVGYSKKYSKIELLDSDHKMFNNSEKFGDFHTKHHREVRFREDIACSGRNKCDKWVVVNDKLVDFLEKVMRITKKNVTKIYEKEIGDRDSRERRERRERREKYRSKRKERKYRYDSETTPDDELLLDSNDLETIIIEKKRKRSKKRSKSESDDGLVPTIILGGVLGLFAVLFNMK